VNENVIQGDWKIVKGKARQKWHELSDDVLDSIAGKRDELVGHIQRAYGIAREKAEKQVDEFVQSL